MTMIRDDKSKRRGGKPGAEPSLLSDYYVVKSDGTLTLDLARAAESSTFRDSIRRIREHNLELELAGK